MTKTITVTGADELAKQVGLPATKAQEIMLGYSDHAKALSEYEADYERIINTKEITPELCAEAKALRLKLVKVRTGSDETHKNMKADVLLVSRAIDGAKNIFQLQVKEREQPLQKIEKHFELIEAAKAEKKAAARREELTALGWEDNGTMDLVGMSDELYEGFLEGLKSKKAAAEREEKERAEREAEAERVKKVAADRLKQIDENGLRYFVDSENLNDIGSLTDDNFKIIVADATVAKKKKEDEEEATRQENERLAAENKKNAAAAAKASKAKKAAVDKAIKEAVTRRRAEADRLEIIDYLPEEYMKTDKVGEIEEATWAAGRDAAVKQKKEADALEIEKTKKNTAYRDWLKENNVTPEQLKSGEYALDVQAEGEKTKFTLSKVIATTVI